MSQPTIDLSSLMNCTLPLQIDGIQWTQDPIVRQDIGRVATSVKAEGTGFLSSPDLATLASAIATLQANSRISGVDFKIMGVGGQVLHSVLAADCYEGGPHINFSVLDKDGGLYRSVKFSVSAKCFFALLVHTWRLRVSTAIDSLQTIVQEGTIESPTSGTVFSGTVLPAFQAAYPPAQYLITYEADYPFGDQISAAGTETNLTDITTRYRITGVQLASTLPSGGSAVVVDGEVTQRSERDEQMRLTTVTEYELQLLPGTGDWTSLVAALRPADGTPGNTQLVSETISFSNIKAWKLRCSFSQLGSADGDGRLNYTRTISYIPNDQSYETYTYPGTSPIAVAKPTTFTRLTDTGSTTALGEFLSPPDPLLETYESPPQFKFTDISNAEKRTEWDMSMLDITNSASLVDLLPQIQRPATGGTAVV